MNKWKVRAEITGEFVTSEVFDTYEEAEQYYNKLHDQFIYNELEIYEVR